MPTKLLQLSQTSLVELLKTLPQQKILEIFDSLLVSYDDKPLTAIEKKKFEQGLKDIKNGELVNWESIR